MRFIKAEQAPDEYIQHYMGVSLTELLAPIGEDKVGESVRHNGVYFNIKEARDSDDPTLPLGVWTHDLKTANWHQVKQLALSALAEKSKDLQLGVWLFEASIHINGFDGIAPAALLIKELCEEYWPTMHPQMVDDDIEYRTNPLNWLNDKLTPILKQTPITLAQLDGEEYSWNDWETAQHYEKLNNQQQVTSKWDGPTPKAFKQRLGATGSDDLLKLIWNIEDGIQALDNLQEWLDDCCGSDSPNLADMNNLLNQIFEMVGTELQRRGISATLKQDQLMAAGESEQADGNDESAGDDNSAGGNNGGSGGGGNRSNSEILDRTDAFVSLRKAAEFLMKDNPHSPVPYLVYTACEWGEKSAPDLYQELFLIKGGQLNIFEMMGLEVDQK